MPPTPRADAPQVSHGLNLTLELANPQLMPVLLAQIAGAAEATRAALDELHFVHFARFLPTRGNTSLLVVTEFDGPLQPYVMDFVIAIGDIFDVILKFIKDAPPLPVRRHPDAFWKFIQCNNVVDIGSGMQWVDYPVYSAYPQRTVIDIVGPRRSLPPPTRPVATSDVDLSDVQANILTGLRVDLARHYALAIFSAAGARRFLSAVLDGDGTDAPRVTTAQRWAPGERPRYFLNIGVTASGLQALGVPDSALQALPQAFVQGPAAPARAQASGDVGASAPEHWELGGPGQPAHLHVSLYGDADHEDEFLHRAGQLERLWSAGQLQILVRHEPRALPDGKVHFGYRDGIAQPRIAGVHADTGADLQPRSSAGEFLLGADYVDVYGGSSLGAMPADLCQNATFAAVRVLEQDVGAFERVLADAGAAHTVDPELIAAKIMGRWRDGTPVAVSPAGAPAAPPQSSPSNRFDYAASHEHPGIEDDHAGRRCPVGAHIRRLNPRSALVAGVPHTRRIIRRGMPYGPAWDDGVGPLARRGLYGLFICADLEHQFEFLMQVWANGDTATSGVRGTLDPIVGAQPDTGGSFRIPGADPLGDITLTLPRLVTTRGSLYVLLPGIRGLRFLASLTGGIESEPGTTYTPRMSPKQWLQARARGGPLLEVDPQRFDPMDPSFLADPYPYYAMFRDLAPVLRVRRGDYDSFWVYSHELVTAVCEQQDVFLKEPTTAQGDRGLFYMDPPRHDEVRAILDPMFAQAIQGIAASAQALADEAIAEIVAHGPSVELISAYANRVTRNSFMTMFGVPAAQWNTAGALINAVLENFNPFLPSDQRTLSGLAGAELEAFLSAQFQGCPAHRSGPELLCRMQLDGQQKGMRATEVLETAVHFALGGYLSTQFLIGTGIYNLLSTPGALARYRSAGPAERCAAIEEMKRFDAPFQLADRYAATPTRLGPCEVPAGAKVTVVYGSANRDERVFGADARQFRIDRKIDPRLNCVFGHGIHFCIGAPMVAAVAPVVFDTLIEAMPGLALTGSMPQRVFDPYYRAFASLDLHF